MRKAQSACKAPQWRVWDIAAHYHTCPIREDPVELSDVSTPGPSILNRELLLRDQAKRPPVPLSAGGWAPPRRIWGWGRCWFCLGCWQEKEGVFGLEVVRFTKALVGPAGLLAPVNQAVIEEYCLGLNVSPLTVSGWHYSSSQRDASATLHTKRLLVSLFMLSWIKGLWWRTAVTYGWKIKGDMTEVYLFCVWCHFTFIWSFTVQLKKLLVHHFLQRFIN